MNKKNDEQSLRPKVALVLSGGAVKCMAHIGVIEALEKAKIPIDMIVGCSGGSVVGAYYAQKPNAGMLHDIMFDIWPTSYSYTLLGLPSLRKGILGQGFFSMNRIKNVASKALLVNQLEDLKIPTYVVATQLNSGTLKVFSSGPLMDILCASGAIPGVFEAILINGEYYVDGGVISALPVSVAKEKGADVIIASDVSREYLKGDKTAGNVLFKTWNIIRAQDKSKEEKIADVLMRPLTHRPIALWEKREELEKIYESGKKVAETYIPDIKKAITAAKMKLQHSQTTHDRT